jgi:hypothetical protein
VRIVGMALEELLVSRGRQVIEAQPLRGAGEPEFDLRPLGGIEPYIERAGVEFARLGVIGLLAFLNSLTVYLRLDVVSSTAVSVYVFSKRRSRRLACGD